MKRIIKLNLFLVLFGLLLFSCTSKEEQVKEYVEKEVIPQAEDYFICQSILKFVHEDVNTAFTEKINYYVNNPYYDYTYAERDLGGMFMSLASTSGAIKAKFDERWAMSDKLLTMLWYEGNLREKMRQLDSTLTFKSLLKEGPWLSIDAIADIYFKPDHMKFTEITPRLYREINLSIMFSGAATYKYDAVDDIRVHEKDYNIWTVDLVYHSGYCLNLEIRYDKDNGCFLSEAPWIPDAYGWGEEDELGLNDESPIN